MLHFEQVCDILSRIINKKIIYKKVSAIIMIGFCKQQGFPEYFAEAHSTSSKAIASGEYALLSDDFESIVKRKSQSLECFLRSSLSKMYEGNNLICEQ